MTEHKNRHDMNITKIDKYKRLIRTEQHKKDMNITKIEKDKKLNTTVHKTDMNITKINKYKKLSSTSTVEYKTNMSITAKLSSTFTKEL